MKKNKTTLPKSLIDHLERDRNSLVSWYLQNRRTLPWRQSRDPYRIWISEVMLQQTTVAAVVPYYEKMLTRFPTVHDLARATESEVFEMWAGLGYYSRARNLHKAAQILSQHGFPQTAQELIELPGFGPYTSRAVASLAFNEHVGVLDGNVIRVLSRFYGLNIAWWNNKEKQHLQEISDLLANTSQNADVNQALMELGATICTPKKTLCLMCPWKQNCVALKKDLVSQLPLSKPKDQHQVWLWTITPEIKNRHIRLHPNDQTPFLKKMLFPAGEAQMIKEKPKKFDLRHSVTKYDIYIQIKEAKAGSSNKDLYKISEIKKINPTSLMTKILKFLDKSSKIDK